MMSAEKHSAKRFRQSDRKVEFEKTQDTLGTCMNKLNSLRLMFAAGVQALLALAGEACTPAISNLPKLFRTHSLVLKTDSDFFKFQQ